MIVVDYMREKCVIFGAMWLVDLNMQTNVNANEKGKPRCVYGR